MKRSINLIRVEFFDSRAFRIMWCSANHEHLTDRWWSKYAKGVRIGRIAFAWNIA